MRKLMALGMAVGGLTVLVNGCATVWLNDRQAQVETNGEICANAVASYDLTSFKVECGGDYTFEHIEHYSEEVRIVTENGFVDVGGGCENIITHNPQQPDGFYEKYIDTDCMNTPRDGPSVDIYMVVQQKDGNELIYERRPVTQVEIDEYKYLFETLNVRAAARIWAEWQDRTYGHHWYFPQ